MKKFLIKLSCATGIVFLVGCHKTLSETDPASGISPAAVSPAGINDCQIITITQINGDKKYNQWTFDKDSSNHLKSIDYFNFITSKHTLNYQFQYKGDTVFIDSTTWVLKNHISGNVIKYFTKDKVTDSITDLITYDYLYNNNRLTEKSVFYNQTSKPDFITKYYYEGNNLINCQMFTGDGKERLLQSKFAYDQSKKIKTWLYLFSDAFESYHLLPGLLFGSKPDNPIVKIETIIYNVADNAIKDNWNTTFSGYVYSQDSYVLQVTTNGDFQQGIGLLLGTQRFSYQCKP